MAWLEIIGVQGRADENTLQSCATADCIIGNARHLAEIKKAKIKSGCKIMAWPRPLLDIIPLLEKYRGRHVVILATGDPLWYGVAATLTRYFNSDEMKITPTISGFQLAAARLGWPLGEVTCMTVHGRPHENVLLHLAPGARILVLAHDKKTPATIAALLNDNGLGAAQLTALGEMAGARESRHSATAAAWDGDTAVPDFHVLAIQCPDETEPHHPRIPGLADDVYESCGTITKQEVRAITLAALMPFPGALLWDCGCGAGSVGIEWMRTASRAQAVGIDTRAGRLAIAESNAKRLGVPGWCGIHGTLPDCLDTIPADAQNPDAVFIGGGITAALIARCSDTLPSGGRLVANAVTTASEAMLAEAHANRGGMLRRIAIARSDAIATGRHALRPLLPVTQWVWRKA